MPRSAGGRGWRPARLAAAILRQAAASKTLVVTRLDGPHALRIGYAAAASGPHGSYVVYAEAPLPPLPPSRRFPQSANSPISQLDLAIYLGRSQTSAALLVTNSTASLPLSGRRSPARSRSATPRSPS